MHTAFELLHLIKDSFEDLCDSKDSIGISSTTFILDVSGPGGLGEFLATFLIDEERKKIVLEMEKDELPDLNPELEQEFLPVLHTALRPFLEEFPVPDGSFISSLTREGERTLVYVSELNYAEFGEDDEEFDLLQHCILALFGQSIQAVSLGLSALHTAIQVGERLSLFDAMRTLTHAHALLGILKTDELIEAEKGKEAQSDYSIINFPEGLYGGIFAALSDRR